NIKIIDKNVVMVSYDVFLNILSFIDYKTIYNIFGEYQLCNLFVRYNDYEEDNCQNIFNFFVKNWKPSIVKTILQCRDIDPSAHNNRAIRKASIFGNKVIVKILVKDSRVNPYDMENQAIFWSKFN